MATILSSINIVVDENFHFNSYQSIEAYDPKRLGSLSRGLKALTEYKSSGGLG